MRSIGGRFQLSARALATPASPARCLRDRAAERALEDAVVDQVLHVSAGVPSSSKP